MKKLLTLLFLAAFSLSAQNLIFNGELELGTDGYACRTILRPDTNPKLVYTPLEKGREIPARPLSLRRTLRTLSQRVSAETGYGLHAPFQGEMQRRRTTPPDQHLPRLPAERETRLERIRKDFYARNRVAKHRIQIQLSPPHRRVRASVPDRTGSKGEPRCGFLV